MLNNSTRKIAIKQLEKEIELNEEANKAVQLNAEHLFEKREELKKRLIIHGLVLITLKIRPIICK